MEKRFKIGLIILILAVFGLAPRFSPDYILHGMIIMGSFAVMASSWNLLAGYAGLLSFGHVAFFGLGAYAAAFLAIHKLMPFPFTLIAGGILAAFFASLIGYPFIKLRGGYFSLGMLGLAEILHIYFLNEDIWLHSSRGLNLPIITRDIRLFYFLMFGLTIGSIAAIRWLIQSRLGLGLIAIRENEDAARMCGIHSNFYLMMAFISSAFFPGVMGAFYAHYIIYFEASDVFNLVISESMLVMAIFGGMGTFWGPILGTAFIYVLGEVVRATWSTYGHLIVYALILMIVCLFFPKGFLGLLRGEIQVPPWLAWSGSRKGFK